VNRAREGLSLKSARAQKTPVAQWKGEESAGTLDGRGKKVIHTHAPGQGTESALDESPLKKKEVVDGRGAKTWPEKKRKNKQQEKKEERC